MLAVGIDSLALAFYCSGCSAGGRHEHNCELMELGDFFKKKYSSKNLRGFVEESRQERLHFNCD